MKLRRKIASQEFTPAMMPHTRKAVFADVVKLHWFELLMLGFLLLAAYLPTLVTQLLADIYETQILTELQVQTEPEAVRDGLLSLSSFRSTLAFVRSLFLLLPGIVFAGVLRVIRQYAWEEVVFFWRDLGIGVRQNGKQICVLIVLFGLQDAVGVYLNSVGQALHHAALALAAAAYSGVAVLVIFPAGAHMLAPICIYDNNLFQNAKIAFAVYAKSMTKTIPLLLGLTLPFWAGSYLSAGARLVSGIGGMILLPTLLLVWFLFSCAQLDRYINPVFFPELVGKGLYREECADNQKGEDHSDRK